MSQPISLAPVQQQMQTSAATSVSAPSQPERSHADEWTQVTAKSKSRRKRESSLAQNPSTASIPKIRNPPSKTISLARIQADFNSKTKTWQKSECCKATFNIVETKQPDRGWSIERAVCLGVGSFSRENGECRNRSMWQLVIFVDLVRHLERMVERDVEMFVQEPQLTDMDKSFLTAMKIHALDVVPMPGPMTEGYTKVGSLGAAVAHMSPQTFLYEPFMDLSEAMLQEIIAADVELYVGSSVRGLMARSGVVGKLAQLFDDAHANYQFPRFEEDPNVFEGLGIYWKPELDDDP